MATSKKARKGVGSRVRRAQCRHPRPRIRLKKRHQARKAVHKRLPSIRDKQERKFVQRYFIDEFKRNGQTEWEVWTIQAKHTPAVTSKEALARRLKEVV